MATFHQYYEADGAPLEVPSDPAEVADAWRALRTRLRQWFADLPYLRWSDPTRCADWRVSEMAAHLASTAQFLGFTLHEAKKGKATTLLRGFDPQADPAALVVGAAEQSPSALVTALTEADAWVDAELEAITGGGWRELAESPLGRVPAYLALTHMLFDSWVHERDLLLPAGETPLTDPAEASAVAAYVFGLAGVVRAADEGPRPDVALQLQLTDLDLVLTVQRVAGHVRVATGAVDVPVDAAGSVSDLVDYATGRHPEGQPFIADAAATYLTKLATGMN